MAGKTLSSWKLKAAEWTRFNSGAEDVNYNDLDTDIRIVIARPFIEYAPRHAQSHSFENALTVLPWCARAGT